MASGGKPPYSKSLSKSLNCPWVSPIKNQTQSVWVLKNGLSHVGVTRVAGRATFECLERELTANFDWGLELKEDWLLHEDFTSDFAKE